MLEDPEEEAIDFARVAIDSGNNEKNCVLDVSLQNFNFNVFLVENFLIKASATGTI